MSFEWQDRDAAARTLGVDSKTLQAWIDDGRAPSRTNNGRLQVLIEHLDEPDPPAAEEAPAEPEKKKQNKQQPDSMMNGNGERLHVEPSRQRNASSRDMRHEEHEKAPDRQTGSSAQHVRATPTDLELVSKRELQMAGGMVAAWQRLAETSNQDLARARKVGVLSWSLVAVMLVVGGVGLWASTRSVTDAQGKLESTQEKLNSAERAVADTQARAAALQAEVSQRMADLAEANARLSATIERINLTKSQADQLAAQHLLTRQLADKQADTSKSLAETLQGTIDDQKQRIAALEKDLAGARQLAADLTSNMTAMQKKEEAQKAALEDVTKQRDAMRKQVDQLTSDHAAATKMIDDLKKEMAAIRAEMERTKTAEK
jgi:DNA repair exonuclease SbcCD ATPase subunit